MQSFTVNTAAPAKFSGFLATKKNLVPSGLAKKLKLYFEEYARISAKRNENGSDQAEALIRAVRLKAESDPSSANLQAISELDPDSVRRRFAETVDTLDRIQTSVVKRSTDDIIQLRDVVLAAADAELVQIESSQRELAAKYGAVYNPAEDAILMQVAKWRTQAERVLSKGTHPKSIAILVGEIR